MIPLPNLDFGLAYASWKESMIAYCVFLDDKGVVGISLPTVFFDEGNV